MQKILRKRIFRDLKENLFRYLALGFMIILGMYIIISLVGAADTIIIRAAESAEENHIEDGEFKVFIPLTEKETKSLEDDGITLEKMFYLDFAQEDESTLRIYKNRKDINLTALDEGRMAEKAAETVLEKRYCEEKGIHTGDTIQIGGEDFLVVGIGTVPDYDAPLQNLSDSSVDSNNFGLAFVSESAYDKLKAGGKSIQSEEYIYSYLLNGKLTNDELKEELKELKVEPANVEDEYFQEYWAEMVGKKEELEDGMQELSDHTDEIIDKYMNVEFTNLTQFLPVEDNPRVGASADDQIINKEAGLVAGVIIMILFTYVISVFVIHRIEKESSMIGTLYALGVKRRELIRHYLMLPVVITFFAGIIGTAIGYSKWGVNVQMGDNYDYFSTPAFTTIYEPYLLVYGILMPPVIAALVNYFVIRKRLAQPALRLIRNEQKTSGISHVKLGNMGFIGRFRIRQMLRELRTGFTVCFGMFITLLIAMIGIDCYVLCEHISVDNKADTKYAYMYTYKYPEIEVPEGGEAGYLKTLKKEVLGYNLDVTVLGIDTDNPYFEADVAEGKSKVVASSAMAQKYALSVGDKLILTDEEEDMDYAFTVEDIAQFSPGLYVFMDIDSMRELFGKDEDYYNVVFSDEALDIDSGRLYAVTSKEDISKSSDIFVSLMMPMVYMMTILSALIFCIVLYLMMKVMIDRSAFGISLMQIFGYRTKEIRKLYLNGNFYIVAVGAAICLPLSKMLMDAMYPYLVSNIACGIDLRFSWQLYAGIYAAIIILYFLINRMLVGRLKRMVPAEVLKNRE